MIEATEKELEGIGEFQTNDSAIAVSRMKPNEALFAGKEGLDAYRELAPQLPRLLNKGGLAAVEIGHDQAEAVTGLLARDGLSARIANDLAGRARALLLTWSV